MAAKINQLQDRAAAVASLLEELGQVEERTADQNANVAKLSAEAAELEERLAQETAIAARVASLRSKVSATAKPAAIEADKPVAYARHERLAKRDDVFASREDAEISGHWLRGYVFGRADSRSWCENHIDMRALSSNDNAKGGVFAVPSFSQSIIDLANQHGVAVNYANVITMTGNSVYVPRWNGTANTGYFVGDNSEATVSDIGTDNVLLSTKDVIASTRIPNSLIEDSVIDLAAFCVKKLSYTLRKLQDDAFFIGDGTSTYGGIRGIQWLFENTTLGGLNDSGEATLSAVTLDDVAETIGKLPSYAYPGAAWHMTPQVWSTVFLPLALGAGGASALETTNGIAPRFAGFPVKFNDSMRTAPTGGQVIALFGDLMMSSHMGVRKDLSVVSSTDRYIEYRQTYLGCEARFDINHSDVGTASVAGPVVCLTL